MKQLTAVCLVASMSFCCLSSGAQQATAVSMKDKVKTIGSMQGSYAMTKQVLNNGTTDTLFQREQLKIYTDRYMMYVHRNDGDSLADYGIGTYAIRNGKLMEYVFYTANGGAHKDTFELAIDKAGNGYTQVINFPPDSQGVKYILTEEYKNVSKPIKSPLDGAWKQVKVTNIPLNGKMETNDHPTQFKIYQSGHFMWANTSKDSATQKPVSFFGYGTFEPKDKNQIIETNTNSSFATALIGIPVTLQITFKGKDFYTQTIAGPDGKTIEEYQRMK